MSFTLSFSLSVNWLDHVIVELIDTDYIHLWKSLNYVSSNALNILFFKLINVFYKTLNSFTRCEERCYSIVDGEVSESDP